MLPVLGYYAVRLVDKDGNPIDTSNPLPTGAQIQFDPIVHVKDAAEAIINPSTAERQDTGNAALVALAAKVPADPAREGGNLAALAAKNFSTEATLAAIKNADGIKKIADALPAGSNKIGGVDLDSDAAPGAPVPAAAQFVAGTDGANARGLKTDATGKLQVDVQTSPANQSVNQNQVAGGAIATAGPGRQEVAARRTAADPVDASGAPVAIKFARINATADGANTVVAAVTGKKIRVLGYALSVTAAGTIAIQDTAGVPAVLAQFALAANGGVSYAGGLDAPAFETAVGQGLQVNVPAGVDALGHLVYLEI